MPVLAYCIVEMAAVVRTAGAGVSGISIESVDQSELRCFVSDNDKTVGLPAGGIRDGALAFHRVLEEIFRQAAIIPFRFPTIFPGKREVIAHLTEHSVEYCSALSRLRNLVQMEIRLRFRDSTAAPETGTSVKLPSKLTGTEYLQKIQIRHAKLGAAANEFRQACSQLIRGWKQRDSVEGVRCFALIERVAIAEFQKGIAETVVGPELVARVGGPWPATQFLQEE